ncbi:MAG: glycosyltransferase family 9 protein [Saprospiraceae bacterium]|nr:glycosyltransferase family 9 protein [Saprospiraceae bacterium]
MKKILIIRFSSIGDIVLTTPVVRCLKKQTGAAVHYLTKQSFQAVLAANPYVDKVWTFRQEVTEVLPQLRAEGFDLVIDLHRNLRSLRVRLALWNVPSHVFNKLNVEKWLMVNWKINRLPNRHIVDRYLDTVRTLGVVNDGAGLDYFIPAEEEVDAAGFLQERLPPSLPAIPYIAFVTGAAHATKRLPEAKIIAICRLLQQPVVLLGGPDEAESGARIAAAAGPHVVNACGALKLNQSASVVRQASRVISHDTGLMHIAAALNKDIVSVWGNTIPAFGMYPYYPNGTNRNTSIEVTGLSCRPCSKIGFNKCPKGHFKCMQEISETAVASPTITNSPITNNQFPNNQ